MGKKIIISGADFSAVAVASNAVALTALSIVGGDSTVQGRDIQLAVAYTPTNTTQKGVTWSVSGNATIDQTGLVHFNGSADGSVTVTVTSTKNASITASKTISFAIPAIEAPVFSVPAGTYSTDQSVVITGPTGASIYYTTDGTTPSANNGTLYNSAVTVNTSMTLKAVAIVDGQSSAVTSAEYTLTGTLTVAVVDESNNAVSGATVMFGGVTLAETQTSGTYSGTVNRGTGTVMVSKSGFDNASQSVTVGQSTSVSVTLPAASVMDVLETQGVQSVSEYSVTYNYSNQLYLMKMNTRSSMVRYDPDGGFNVTWGGSQGLETGDDKKFAPVQWPDGFEIVDIVFNSPEAGSNNRKYNYSVFNASNTLLTKIGWTDSALSGRFRLTNFPNAKYITFAFYINIGSKTTQQLKDYGLSIMAFKTAEAAAAWYQEQGKTEPTDVTITT